MTHKVELEFFLDYFIFGVKRVLDFIPRVLQHFASPVDFDIFFILHFFNFGIE